ncbi:type II toxin-antitoxin system tRNA(fMet)-specific endonuclease VapC [Nostoc parmelioides]|uniref:Type II toxin-antitoxin system VapC family toxin n=1 Tax=Nostoc parmelioides FACHB-3921 TaxID=2692909 RepID=A0ABR8B7L9_9NOSO|nr:type II toxin-antitoxin system VapC family toxin [Nostoc parmelioides]MBD2250127.1 type II toxin-antitoxin system VapC family toxin [Nostoc parmelioides FACHB-3921]
MTYLLDTNVCIRLINGSNTTVINRLANQQPEDIFISTITQLELYYGAYRSLKTESNLEILERFFSQFNIILWDSEMAKIAGKIRADLAVSGTPIGPYDLQIATSAIARNFILVTHNTREFSRINGLQLEDWEE